MSLQHGLLQRGQTTTYLGQGWWTQCKKRQHHAARISSMRWKLLLKIGRSRHGFALLVAKDGKLCYHSAKLDTCNALACTRPPMTFRWSDGIALMLRRCRIDHQKYRGHQQNIISCVFFDRVSVVGVSFRPFRTELKCVLLSQDKITYAYALHDGCNRFR